MKVSDALKSLEKAAKKAKKQRKGTDRFAVGDVVKWTASGRYTYAAVKTPVGWFTTAREFNSFVPQVVTWAELVAIVERPETTDVAVAESWVFLNDSIANTDPQLGPTVEQLKGRVVESPLKEMFENEGPRSRGCSCEECTAGHA